jgi:hypothetical protein
LFDQWIGIFCRGPDEGVEAGALGVGSLILIQLEDLLVAFLAFFLMSRVGSYIPFAGPSL